MDKPTPTLMKDPNTVSSSAEDMCKEFEFNNASEDEAFEDSIEDHNLLMTPKTFKSDFAKKIEAISTPKATPKRSATFSELSPIEPEKQKKAKALNKTRLSSLPRVSSVKTSV